MGIKVVLFDATGVLFPANLVVGEALAAKFNLSDEQRTVMWQGFYQDYTVGRLNTEQFLDTFAETFELPRDNVHEEDFAGPFRRALAPMPGIVELLERLQGTGVVLAMLSDTTEMFAKGRDVLGIGQYFDHEFLSYEIGYKKPDPHAFRVVLSYYDVKPEMVYFIDDNLENVDAAVKLGMQAVRFTDSPSLEQALGRAGVKFCAV